MSRSHSRQLLLSLHCLLPGFLDRSNRENRYDVVGGFTRSANQGDYCVSAGSDAIGGPAFIGREEKRDPRHRFNHHNYDIEQVLASLKSYSLRTRLPPRQVSFPRII